MNSIKIQDSTVISSQGTAATSVFVLYENLPSGLRAQALLDRLGRQCASDGMLFNRNWWKFNLLGKPLLREQAAIEAAAADIILVSMDKQMNFPEEVQDWLNRWADRKEPRAYALGLMLDPAQFSLEDFHPVIAHLRKFADGANADFFCCPSDTNAVTAQAAFHNLQERANFVSCVLDEILKISR